MLIWRPLKKQKLHLPTGRNKALHTRVDANNLDCQFKFSATLKETKGYMYAQGTKALQITGSKGGWQRGSGSCHELRLLCNSRKKNC